LSDKERIAYNHLSKDPLHLEEIITKSNLSAGDINSALVSLQLKGLTKQLPGNMFLRK
ncbi:MAG: DprA-like winged helix domain-containing protein, partial [Planctomycetota bacterium]